MKQIIINHILNLRAEYPEVPDGDFQPAKMEAAFEQVRANAHHSPILVANCCSDLPFPLASQQAFSTWRGKVLGRVKGRHDNDDD